MRNAIIIMVLSIVGTAIADQYVYVRDGRVQSAPRELPAAAVRLDTGETILGMHARTDAVRAACGWYRVVPSAQTAGNGAGEDGRCKVLGRGEGEGGVACGG